MKVEELMIDDWVQYQYTGGIFQIVKFGLKQKELNNSTNSPK